MSEVKSQKSSDRDRRLVSLSISMVEIRLGSWLSIRLRCSRELVLGLEREAREQGVTTPSMNADDNHFNCLLLDRISSKSCWILEPQDEEHHIINQCNKKCIFLKKLNKCSTMRHDIHYYSKVWGQSLFFFF